DYMKAEAPEMQALLRLLCEWDPLICADIHVTDGADFEPDISLQAEPINQGDPLLYSSGREMRDELIDKLTGQGALPLHFYPDFAISPDGLFAAILHGLFSAEESFYHPRRNPLVEKLRATHRGHPQHDRG